MFTKQWEAVIKVHTPAGQAWNATANRYQTDTSARLITVVVPDSGGYHNTKALLEGSYGYDSVRLLKEKHTF
jgi:hypothetical protein